MAATSICFARPGIRAFSGLLDLVLFLVPALLLRSVLPENLSQSQLLGYFSGIGVAGLLYLIMFWSFLQATPGMLLAGTRLVSATTSGRPGLARCGLRAGALLLAVAPLGLGLLLALRDPRKRGLHDLIAATHVIEDDEAVKSLKHILQELP